MDIGLLTGEQIGIRAQSVGANNSSSCCTQPFRSNLRRR
jgi:hypothetical protein